ncbi:MAG: hypothetical protein JRN39_06390, partial [Nitrososphaerota archaeon]|nr:hypothetical protein [Nitrososphaerota archaeon]
RNPSTIREVFDHVNGTQYYYLARTGIVPGRGVDDFGPRRELCIRKVEELYHQRGNSRVWQADGESWTLKKMLRRFVWHDRIHGKAIVRMLRSQKEQNLISGYRDPFCFALPERHGSGVSGGGDRGPSALALT